MLAKATPGDSEKRWPDTSKNGQDNRRPKQNAAPRPKKKRTPGTPFKVDSERQTSIFNLPAYSILARFPEREAEGPPAAAPTKPPRVMPRGFFFRLDTATQTPENNPA